MTAIENSRFKVGASHTIGSYVLPGKLLDAIYQEAGQKIKLILGSCEEIVHEIKTDILDIGFIEFPIYEDSLILKKWMEDELVVCSTKELPSTLTKEEIQNFRLISREKDSLAYAYVETFLKDENLSYDDFYAITEVDKPTAIIKSVLWARPKPPLSTVAIVSKSSIEDESKQNKLHVSKIHNKTMKRNFYIVYKKDLAEKFDLSILDSKG
ncbi:MAG TPA: hypothetical protein ENK82_08155 [Campylobacterales bacterium]|nr:hypothetical protein [Campylobacterales bacterium]HHS93306.1 hypothetical protein [Campylobacterales bacterium]